MSFLSRLANRVLRVFGWTAAEEAANRIATGGKSPKDMTREERQRARQTRQAVKTARRAARITRRFGR